MKITLSNIRIFPVRPKDGLVTFASAIVNDELYIGSIAIHKKRDGTGYRLTYPTRKSQGKDLNIFHPITVSCSLSIEQAIVDAYLLNAKTVNNAGHYYFDASHSGL